MIDPKLVTPENGFIEGCVVEIKTGVVFYERFKSVLNKNITILDSDGCNGYIDASDIVSIRPLTGPMAIWNFAPEWAEWLVEDSVSFRWYKSQPDIYLNAPEDRPFWATRSGE